MKICIKENEFNPSLLYQKWCSEEMAIEMGYTIVEVDEKYADCCFEDFNEDLTFNVDKYNARKQKEVNQKRIAEIKIWFEEYDNQVKQYQRCVRLGIDFDKDIIELDNQAKAYQEELRMYNDYVEQCKAEVKEGIGEL